MVKTVCSKEDMISPPGLPHNAAQMTDAIATALVTMTADNLLATDQWEICKQPPTLYGGRAAEGQGAPTRAGGICPGAETSLPAKSNSSLQPQSKLTKGKEQEKFEILLTCSQLSLILSDHLCGSLGITMVSAR